MISNIMAVMLITNDAKQSNDKGSVYCIVLYSTKYAEIC
jgi:hypothetical protein